MGSEPSVCVVVVNWNGLADTIQCLESLQHLTYRGQLQILVVDNGSEDGSAATLRSRFPWARLIENGENLGYTGGNNVGLRYALAEGAEYIWLLNNDATVDPDSLSCLVRSGEATERIGLLSPRVWLPGTADVYWAGSVLDVAQREFVDVVATEKRGMTLPEGPLLLAGTGILIKRAVIETIGFLDNRYFAYVEDFDYSLRAIKSGMQTCVVHEARIFHARSRSLGYTSPLRHYMIRRNQYLFWRSHLGKEWTRRESGRLVAKTLREAEEWRREGRSEMSRACMDALWDALRGHFGAMNGKGRTPWLVRSLLEWHPFLWIWLLGEDIATSSRKSERGCGREGAYEGHACLCRAGNSKLSHSLFDRFNCNRGRLIPLTVLVQPLSVSCPKYCQVLAAQCSQCTTNGLCMTRVERRVSGESEYLSDIADIGPNDGLAERESQEDIPAV